MSDRFCTCFGCTSDKPTRCEYAESDIVTALRAEVERLTRERDEARADLREARMQAITDAGQVQEAYEVKRAAEAERDRLREALTECADDLAAEIEARYPESTRVYSSEQRRYDRDMGAVLRARAALKGEA